MKLFFLFITSVLSLQQFSIDSKDWNKGNVTLLNNNVLSGQVLMCEEVQLLLLKQGEITTIFAPDSVKSFSYHDKTSDEMRHFVTKEIKGVSKSEVVFFELIVQGEVPLFKSHKYLEKDRSGNLVEVKNSPYPFYEWSDYSYYVVMNQELINLYSFKKEIYPKLKRTHPEELHSYVKKKRLGLSNPTDQVKILKFYNELLEERKTAAAGNKE